MNSFRSSLEISAIGMLEWVMRTLSLRSARAAGRGLGALLDTIGIRKKVMLENLRNAYPELSEKERAKIASGVYRSFGMTFSEFARLPLFTSENIYGEIEFHGFEHVTAALAQNKGVIGVSGHLGNWEWMGAGTALRGIPMTYIVASQQNSRVEQRMDSLRAGCGIEIINRKNAVKATLRALKSNRMVAILCDQDAHREGAFVPFFGRLASAPRGAMVFALTTGAPILFTEGVRIGDKLHVTYEPIDLSGLPESRDEAVVEGMARITARLEQSVRRHPEQWLWLHKRWKTAVPTTN